MKIRMGMLRQTKKAAMTVLSLGFFDASSRRRLIQRYKSKIRPTTSSKMIAGCGHAPINDGYIANVIFRSRRSPRHCSEVQSADHLAAKSLKELNGLPA